MNDLINKKCKVIKDHTKSYPDSVRFNSGDKVTITEKESKWPNWAWCTNKSGECGWVPENYLDITENDAVVLYDYSTIELTVQTGDELTAIKEASGWYWCRDKNDSEGWVPKENIEIR